MPANPDDSYLSRIEKSLNDMTGQDSAAPEQNAQTDFVVEPAEGSEEYVEPQTQKDILTPASDKNYDPLNSRRRMPQHVGTY